MSQKTRKATVDAIEPDGIVVAMVSPFGEPPDLQGDIIDEHAYDDDIRYWATSRSKLPVLISHDWADESANIGYVESLEAHEGYGLVAVMRLDMTNPRARYIHKLLTERRQQEFSIGYDILPGGQRKRADGATVLTKLHLIEISCVLKGAAATEGERDARTELLLVKQQTRKDGANCPRCGRWIGSANPQKVPAGWGYSFRMCRGCWAVVLDREDSKSLTSKQRQLELDRLNAHLKSLAGSIENEIAGIFAQHGLWDPDVQQALRRRVRDSLEHDEFDRRALQLSLEGFIEAHTAVEDDDEPATKTVQAAPAHDPGRLQRRAVNAELDNIMSGLKATHPAVVPNAELEEHLRTFHSNEIGPDRIQRNTLAENLTVHALFHRTGGTGPDLSALTGKDVERAMEKLRVDVRADKEREAELEHIRMFGSPPGVSVRFDEAEDDAYYARQIAAENEERARREEERAIEADARERGDAINRDRAWSHHGVASSYHEPIGAEPTAPTPPVQVNVGVHDEVKEPERFSVRTASWDSAEPNPETRAPETARVASGDGPMRMPVGGSVTEERPLKVDESTVRVSTVNVDDERRRIEEGESK